MAATRVSRLLVLVCRSALLIFLFVFPTATSALAVEGSITGHVQNSSGTALAGINVMLSNRDPGSGDWLAPFSAISNGSGIYLIKYVTPGSYKLCFSDPTNIVYSTEYFDNERNVQEALTVSVGGGENLTGYDATLERKGSISGRLTDGIGRPLDYVTAELFARDPVAGWRYITYAGIQSDGTYHFRDVDCDEYILVYYGTDHPIHFYGGSTTASATPVTVSDGQAVTGIDRVMTTRYGSIGGIVTHSDGRPLTGAYVTLGGTWSPLNYDVTDASGRWLLDILNTGSYTLRFEESSHRTEYYDDRQIESTAYSFGVTSSSHYWTTTAMSDLCGSIQGVVGKEGGKAFKGARVDLYKYKSAEEYYPASWNIEKTAYASATGSYSFGNLLMGKYKLRFMDVTGFHITEFYNGRSSLATAHAIDIDGNSVTASASLAVTPNIAWVYADKDSNGDPIWRDSLAAKVDSAGNVYVTGKDFCVMKLNRVGRRVWLRRPSTKGEEGRFISFDGAGNIIVAGIYQKSLKPYDDDIAIVKYSPAGALLWSRVYDGPGGIGSQMLDNDGVSGMLLDSRGNIFISGRITGKGRNGKYLPNVMLMKLDQVGRRVWLRNDDFGTSDAMSGDDRIADMTMDSKGNIILTGARQAAYKTEYDLLTVKYGPGGRLLWNRYYLVPKQQFRESGSAVVTDGSGYVYVAGFGEMRRGSNKDYDMLFFKYSPAGRQLFAKRLNSSNNGNDVARDLVYDGKSGLYLIGTSRVSQFMNGRQTVYKFSSAGRRFWTQENDPTLNAYEELFSGAVDLQGNLVVCGKGGRPFECSEVIKYNSAGTRLMFKRYATFLSVCGLTIDRGSDAARRNDIYLYGNGAFGAVKILN